MDGEDTALQRLRSQRLAGVRPGTPREVVAWMGAVQAQDRLASLWAIGLRMRKPSLAGVERAVARGEIVRTWPMRGTLHFVAAADARAMIAHLAPRALDRAAGRRRELGLTAPVLEQSRRALVRALTGGQRLTRPDAYAQLGKAGVATGGQRGIHILGHLAQEGTLCLGPPEGAQATVVLLDEWVPRPRQPAARAATLAALAARYVASHGPATDRDYAWWTGLTLRDAREALAAAGADLVRTDHAGDPRWMGPGLRAAPRGEAHLLPAFDEFLVAYQDRGASLARAAPGSLTASTGLLSPVVVLDGQVVGRWTRTMRPDRVAVRLRWIMGLDATERETVARAAQRYADFLGVALDLDQGRA